jgi:hypothetical protein
VFLIAVVVLAEPRLAFLGDMFHLPASWPLSNVSPRWPASSASCACHNDPSFTLRVYAHLLPSTEDRAQAAVDDALGGGAKPAARDLDVPGEPLRGNSPGSDVRPQMS